MAKIPRQRTGSGGWPDRRRAVSYSKKSGGGKGGSGKGCAVLALAFASTVAALTYGAVELVRFIA